MLRFISRRTLAIVPTLLLVYTIVFFIAHATPGTPWDMKSERPVPPQVEENLNRKYNLDAPLPEQYLTYRATPCVAISAPLTAAGRNRSPTSSASSCPFRCNSAPRPCCWRPSPGQP